MKMRAMTVFQNRAIQNGRDGYVEIGDAFETDEVHGRELLALHYAIEAEDEPPKARAPAKTKPAA